MSVCLTVLIFHQNPQIFISSFGQSIVNETLDPFLHWHLLLLFCIFIGVHLSKGYMFPRVWRRIIRPGDILACKAHTFLQYLVDSTNIFLFYIWYSYMHVFFCGPFVLACLLYFFYYCKIRCSRRGVQSSTECCCIRHCPLYSITYTHINTYQMLSNFASCLSRIK